MELTQLKYFLIAAQTQHITKSAQMLHIAQPALTKSLKSLEEELSLPLFAKKGRNVVLTVYGRFLYERLKPLIASIDDLPNELLRLAQKEEETIRICVLSASMPVARAVMKFRAKHPSVIFQITQNPTDELYDIRVTTKLPSESYKDESIHILNEEIFIAVPNTEEYTDINVIKLSELSDKGFVSLLGSRQLRIICDKFCRSAGFEPNIVFESDSPDTAKNMIEAGIGVGFWPKYAWGEHPTGNIKLLRFAPEPLFRELVISKSKSTVMGHLAEEFYDYLISSFDEI